MAGAVIEAALSGQGIVLQDENILCAEVAHGRLVHLLPDWTRPTRDVSVIYPPAGTCASSSRDWPCVEAGLSTGLDTQRLAQLGSRHAGIVDRRADIELAGAIKLADDHRIEAGVDDEPRRDP